MVAIKNNVAILIDCKTLNNKNGLFPVSRIEENQRLAAKRFYECGNSWFNLCILWNNTVYMLPIKKYDLDNIKSIDVKTEIPFVNNFYEKLEMLLDGNMERNKRI